MGRGPNKLGRELRQNLNQLLLEDFSKFVEAMGKLKGADYVDAYMKACRLVLPALQAISLDTSESEERQTLAGRLATLCENKDSQNQN